MGEVSIKNSTASTDTIVAVATSHGRGGIGIVRLSGPRACFVGQKLFQPRLKDIPVPWPSHQLIYGSVGDSQGAWFDDCMVVRMESPHSYTGEDVVEFQCHGSPVILDQVVSACLAQGVRLAGPGEFTRRAFLNGKMDLVQAEAVAELIEAQSQAEVQAAQRRLEGRLSKQLHSLRKKTISILAECEADIDFPEENLPLSNQTEIIKKIKEIQCVTKGLLKTYERNQTLKSGFVVALIGQPNVGKSSLFNALLSMDRAIVTPSAGTTRDVLREELLMGGVRIRLLDTAGLSQNSKDLVEKMGMERTQEELSQADLVCLVCSVDQELTSWEKNLLKEHTSDQVWLVWNKTDLLSPSKNQLTFHDAAFPVSAKHGQGLEDFRNAIGATAKEKSDLPIQGGISTDRQRNLLVNYQRFISQAAEAWKKGTSPEFVAFELRQAYQALSRLLGKDESMETVLDEIFSRFCIGK